MNRSDHLGKGLSRGAVRFRNDPVNTIIATSDKARVKRERPKEGYTKFLGRVFASALLEDVKGHGELSFAIGLRRERFSTGGGDADLRAWCRCSVDGETAHVFDHTQNGYFQRFREGDGFPAIEQRNLLRCGHDDHAVDIGKGLGHR